MSDELDLAFDDQAWAGSNASAVATIATMVISLEIVLILTSWEDVSDSRGLTLGGPHSSRSDYSYASTAGA